MKFKKLVKITSKQNPGIFVKDKMLVATNNLVLAEVPFEQTGEKLLDGAYKKGYFDSEIDTVHDGQILYANELLLAPVGQGGLDFPKYDNMLLMENPKVSMRIDLAVFQKLIDVFKEQRDTEVEIHFKDGSTPVLLVGKKMRGIVMPLSAVSKKK